MDILGSDESDMKRRLIVADMTDEQPCYREMRLHTRENPVDVWGGPTDPVLHTQERHVRHADIAGRYRHHAVHSVRLHAV